MGHALTLHYSVQLVGDGTSIEDTRTSGYGDRPYGQPLQFELGDLGDLDVLRALHSTALDMRVGGVRRVRTSLLEPDFGYRDLPTLIESREGRKVIRRLQGDWLVDVTVDLLAVELQRPTSSLTSAIERIRMAAADLLGQAPSSPARSE